jgi:hypothetical protein
MLPPLFARPPIDPTEERRIRRLAHARHAPASWLQRARIITLSWDGAQVGQQALTAHQWVPILAAPVLLVAAEEGARRWFVPARGVGPPQ